VFVRILEAGNAEVGGLKRKQCGEGHPVLFDATTSVVIWTWALFPLKYIPPHGGVVRSLHNGLELILGVLPFWSRPPSTESPQFALRRPFP
jgi:hypothetical protein